jgi:hypothetical protein
VLKFSRRQAFGQSSTSVRMDSAMGIGSDCKCEMDQSLGPAVKGPRLTDGSAELLNGCPHIGVLIRDVLWNWRQSDCGIFGEISRR